MVSTLSNYIHYKVWDEITYPFTNFSGTEKAHTDTERKSPFIDGMVLVSLSCNRLLISTRGWYKNAIAKKCHQFYGPDFRLWKTNNYTSIKKHTTGCKQSLASSVQLCCCLCLTHYDLAMPYGDIDQSYTCSGDGLVPDGTRLLSAPRWGDQALIRNHYSVIILCMHPASERRRHNVT